jgi:hypothetical protein
LLAFHRRNYRKALRLVEIASVSSSQRRWSARATGRPGVRYRARVMLLQAVFEGLQSGHALRTLH